MYTITKIAFTTRQVELVRKKEFAAVALNLNNNIFIVHVTSIDSSDVHPSFGAQIALLKVDEALTAVLLEYVDFANVISLDLVAELPKHIRIHNYTINLINGKQPPYQLNLKS